LRNQDLNKLLDKPPDSATEIAVYAKEGVSIARFAKKIYSELKKYYNVFPPILTRSEYSEQRSENKDKEIEKLAVVSVDAQLDQLKNILDAFLIGTYFVLIIFLFIVMAGIVNTYRVLIYERTREIGTMRAIGMQSYEVKLLFLGEAVLLAVVSCLTGFFAGFIILNILKLIVIGNNAVSAIFVENGKLNYFIGAKMFFLNIFFMLFAVVLAAWGTASKAGNMPPAEALRKE
jgi:putative ABC transport system permease protein